MATDSQCVGIRARRRARLLAVPDVQRAFRVALWVAVGTGIAFRLRQYLASRSLWFDEAALALNIVHRSAAGLTRTLDFAQAAPIGFVELEKLATHALGLSEPTLRLLPLLCGLASVPLFAVLSLRILRPWAAALATALFACAAGPIYYASEVKQYSCDVVVAIGLVLLGLTLAEGRASGVKGAVVAIAGAVAILFSHPAVFVAGAIAFALFARLVVRRDRIAVSAALATLPWIVAGAFVVVFTNARAVELEAVIGSGSAAYPHSATASSQLDWIRTLFSSLLRATGFPDAIPDRYSHWPVLVGAAAGALGLAWRRRMAAAMLGLPLALLWIASEVHKYPVFDRTVLFLVPAGALFLAEGVSVATRVAMRGRGARVAVGACLASAVLIVPAVHAVGQMVDPMGHEEIKPALQYIRAHWRPGDALFVDSGARFALSYYLDCSCMPAVESRGRAGVWRFVWRPGGPGRAPVPLQSLGSRFAVGQLEDGGSVRSLREQFKGVWGRPRVWILYTHLSSPDEARQIAATLRRLDATGRRLAAFDAVGAHAYLFDLRLTAS